MKINFIPIKKRQRLAAATVFINQLWKTISCESVF